MLICILACDLAFHAITSECSRYTKIAFKKNEASVAMNPLVSLFRCFVALGNRRTDRHTHTHTHTHSRTKYRNPRCTCVPPRVKYPSLFHDLPGQTPEKEEKTNSMIVGRRYIGMARMPASHNTFSKPPNSQTKKL